MDIPLLIRHRLNELDLDQKDLAAAAQVTESYISQLLARKKAPPAPSRTDIYDKIAHFLRLPPGQLASLADVQRKEELKKKLTAPPAPLLKECRQLILRKCHPDRRPEVQRIFEKDIFGELERLVTQKLLDAAQSVAREELRSEEWLRRLAALSARSFEQMRVAILEFLDTDIFHVSVEGCVSFLDPMIEAWDIDLRSFGLEVQLNHRLAPASLKRYEFQEVTNDSSPPLEPGLVEFLQNPTLSSAVTPEEIEILQSLRFRGRHPSPLYYYREWQSLRDPLHFPATPTPESRPSQPAPKKSSRIV